MDIQQMRDLAEELLNLYGYEVYRNVGVVGGEITTAELMQDPIYVPKQKKEGIIHRVDILGEKKDIERPFGRICVMYKRGTEDVTPADIYHLSHIMKQADAYYGMFLTTGGISKEAKIASVNNKVEIITQDRLEKLIGKVTMEQPWWQGYPAFEPQVDYKQSLYYFKYQFEKLMHMNWDVLMVCHHQFTWTPYWKFTYYIDFQKEEKPREHLEQYQGFSAINAFTGEMDFVLYYAPPLAKRMRGVDYVMKHEIINRTFRDYRSKIGKVHKPKWIPKNVDFNVLTPALLKHEAKLSAQQHIAKWYDVSPENVIITGRELIYLPVWRIMMFNRPIIKNIHMDTEHFAAYASAVDGESLLFYFLTGSIQPLARGFGKKGGTGTQVEAGSCLVRPLLYPYFERILFTLFGVVNYANVMRRLTWGAVRLYWSFNVRIQRWMLKLAWLGIEAMLWIMTRALALDLFGTIFAFAILNILILPLHSIVYVWHDALRLYPHKTYPHPDISKKDIESVRKKRATQDEGEKAYEKLLSLKKEGKLSGKQDKDIGKIRGKIADKYLKRLGA